MIYTNTPVWLDMTQLEADHIITYTIHLLIQDTIKPKVKNLLGEQLGGAVTCTYLQSSRGMQTHVEPTRHFPFSQLLSGIKTSSVAK